MDSYSICEVFNDSQDATFETDQGIKRLNEIINFEEDLFEELNKVF